MRIRKQSGINEDPRTKWRNAGHPADFDNGMVDWDCVATAVDEFFAWEKYSPRKAMLGEPSSDEVRREKRELLLALRNAGVFVLEKGMIEDYYPPGLTGDGKPGMAQSFCNMLTSRDQAYLLWSDSNGTAMREFDTIFSLIFGKGDQFARGGIAPQASLGVSNESGKPATDETSTGIF